VCRLEVLEDEVTTLPSTTSSTTTTVRLVVVVEEEELTLSTNQRTDQCEMELVVIKLRVLIYSTSVNIHY